MKKFLIFPVLLLLFSCEEEGALTRNVESTTPILPITTVLYTGAFAPTNGVSVSGQARIVLDNNQHKVELSGFSISSGPDLKVYLSKSSLPNEFITLGNLTNATFYAIPNYVNFQEYNHVLIHCQQYNHLFAIAALNSN